MSTDRKKIRDRLMRLLAMTEENGATEQRPWPQPIRLQR